MSFFDKDVKPMSNPKDYGMRMKEIRKKNRNRCARLIRKEYRKMTKSGGKK